MSSSIEISEYKRPRQSPEQISERSKVLRTSLEMSLDIGNNTADIVDTSQLDIRDQNLLTCFRGVVREELDSRFKAFSTQDFLPLKKDVLAVKTDLDTLKAEVQALRDEKDVLRQEGSRSNKQIEFLERGVREQNLIFYNVVKTDNIRQSILDICTNEIKVNGNLSVKRTSVLKEDRSKNVLTVLVQFGSREEAQGVLRSTKNLKNSRSRIGVSKDLSEEERKARSTLFAIKKTIQEQSNNSNVKIKVFGNKFIIEDKTFVYNRRMKSFGNSVINGKDFLKERFGIDFDNFLFNNE